MVESFNGTLKTILRKIAIEKPKDWGRYVQTLLSAYREMPNESTGFSPFELLYGRTPRGPVTILQEVWRSYTGSGDSEYLLVRSRLEKFFGREMQIGSRVCTRCESAIQASLQEGEHAQVQDW